MNQAQGMVNLFVEINTDLNEKEFTRKFQNCVAVKLQLIDSHREIHEIDFADIMRLNWTSFESIEDIKKSPDNAMSSDQTVI